MSTIIFELPKDRFVPGEEITGTVLWDLDSPVKKTIELLFGWWTEGRGNRDAEVLYSWELGTQLTGEFSFTLQVPLAPHSYEGVLLSVVWGLEFQTDKKSDYTCKELIISNPQAGL